MSINIQQNPGSFRDPSGFVFEEEGRIYRSINESYRPHFEKMIQSDLYRHLVEKRRLLPFQESSKTIEDAWKTVEVEKLPFISYPYEWSFHQLKDAAILTLQVHLESLKHGMSLKDASAYNVQFFKGKPIFIDLLSFETYVEGTPWIAYRQYISHFLGPLLLMSYTDIRHGMLLTNYLDGLPIDYVAANLPWRTRFKPSIFINIHLHAKLLKKHESTKGRNAERQTENNVKPMPLKSQINMIEGLLEMTKAVKSPMLSTEWGDYYNDTNYDDASFQEKGRIIESICERVRPKIACDLGANLGEFSRVFAKHAQHVLSPDIDPVAVDRNYRLVQKNKETNIFPFLQNLCNPSPGIGWMNEERSPFLERARCDLAAGLAVIHHLCIGNNLPLEHVARMFHTLAPNAILEFVPKEDSQVQRLLSSREDIFPDYDLEHCQKAFELYYGKCEAFPIAGTCRTILFLSERR